jgi:hypothetical protein
MADEDENRRYIENEFPRFFIAVPGTIRLKKSKRSTGSEKINVHCQIHT